MRKLEKFAAINSNSIDRLRKSESDLINGGIGGATSYCSQYETTCIDNCQDYQWRHYKDGNLVWSLDHTTDTDCQ